MKFKKILFVGLFLMGGTSFSTAAFIGDPAPEFSLPSLNKTQVSLGDFKGDVVFVNFWASWCPPCKQEFPELNKLADEYKDKKFKMLAINLDKSQARVEKYLKSIGVEKFNMEILLDPDSKVVASYVARSMPSSFVIDKNGTIKFVHFGFNKKDPPKWREELDSLLKGSENK